MRRSHPWIAVLLDPVRMRGIRATGRLQAFPSLLLLVAVACSPYGEGGDVPLRESGLASAAVVSAERPPLTDAERAFFLDAARLAWGYIDRNYEPATGFVAATPDWPYTTIWDIGGLILAYLSAKELGLLDSADFDRRTRTTLGTLERVRLFRGIAYNKLYTTIDASVGSGADRAGTGWSATDLGRLLVALRVLSVREPQYAQQAERVVRRIRFPDIVRGGYLHGQLIGRSGRPWTFQEGRIGYEQYMAAGFSAWGAQVENALDITRHAQPVNVMGVRVVRDRRWSDRLVSEPFILMGLELGLPPAMKDLARAILAAQEARYRATGQITIASEDAIGVPPHYFYYYCVYCNNAPFVIDVAVPGAPITVPRWVSTKAAFGWHALMPNAYTKQALEYVAPARDSTQGWASGVFEGRRVSTSTYDVNTASVILEVAAFELRGARPLIEPPARIVAGP